jgi:hypothetical protein
MAGTDTAPSSRLPQLILVGVLLEGIEPEHAVVFVIIIDQRIAAGG